MLDSFKADEPRAAAARGSAAARVSAAATVSARARATGRRTACNPGIAYTGGFGTECTMDSHCNSGTCDTANSPNCVCTAAVTQEPTAGPTEILQTPQPSAPTQQPTAAPPTEPPTSRLATVEFTGEASHPFCGCLLHCLFLLVGCSVCWFRSCIHLGYSSCSIGCCKCDQLRQCTEHEPDTNRFGACNCIDRQTECHD